MYAIVDLETTGGQPEYDQIIEIAVYLHDGVHITGEYSTLVNPGVTIPPFISRLTRITDDMVASAPRFDEVASYIAGLFENRIFVAHNVMFDYSFLKHSLKRHGYDLENPMLCTCKTSRRLFPGHPSYSLGRLCSSLSIKLTNAHRAAADAFATTSILEMLIDKSEGKLYPYFHVPQPRQNFSNIPEPELELLPPRAGLLYFVNDNGEVIYIIKSKNIRKKARAIVGKMKGKRFLNVAVNATHIDFQVTGSHILAGIREAEEIDRFNPRFNRKLRVTEPRFALYEELDSSGCLMAEIRRYEKGSIPVLTLSSQKEALRVLQELPWPSRPATDPATGRMHDVDRDNFNKAMEETMAVASRMRKNFIIADTGPLPSQQTLILIQDARYSGYLVTDRDSEILSPEQMMSRMTVTSDNPAAFKTIIHEVGRGKYERIVHF